MNKNTKYIIALIAVLIIAGSLLFSNSGTTAKLVSEKDVQVVKLSANYNGEYIMSPSKLVKGKTVRLEADMSSLVGCSKTIVIRDFNVRKTFTFTDNVVEFTPDKTGTFWITCSMNMFQGQFSVVDENGAKSAYSEVAPTSTGTYGASGGCGCGG
jgi:plastocyanin domain-containing protein